ncbi:hypothetical protein SCHPADRAFT_838304, partial [Schizopora paradoxa]
KEVEETLVSIRSRIRHTDPYDAWERQTRKDAFHVARAHHSQTLATLRSAVVSRHNATEHSILAAREAERVDLARRVAELEGKRQLEERRLRDAWREREKRLWDRVESSIKGEEDRYRARLEAEKKAREAEERAKLAEEQRRRDEEAKKRKEAEALRLKAEEERKKKEEEERIAQEQKIAQEQATAEQQEGQKMRSTLGCLEARDLWLSGLKAVKGPKAPDPPPANYQPPPAPPLKKIWSAQRRKITPKVGQLTDDPREIARILKAIIAPIPSVPGADQQNLHHALLSSVSKAVLSQAETEVTAHKAAARPLARVIVALIATYPLLGEIFWARMIGSIGVWAVGGIEPTLIEVDDTTGERHELDAKGKLRRWGMREEEPTDAYVSRVAGVLRLYFEMLFVEMDGLNLGNMQLQPQFRPARLWAYLAQLINHEGMLKRVVAPEAIYVALDSVGSKALTIWGAQFVKILRVIYEGTGKEKETWGGPEVVAQASRARCQLEVEKILSA